MIFFNEKNLEAIKKELADFQTIGIISCGGCPSIQKIGGAVGIEKWEKLLEGIVDIKWTVIAPILCDERFFEIHLDQLGGDLVEVDAVLTMTCQAGERAINNIVGFQSVPLLESKFFGLMRKTGEPEKAASLKVD